MGQAMSGMFVGDEVMKGTIASTAFEAMEVASEIALRAVVGEGQQSTGIRPL
jgi:ferritin-like metal-binding protein YciE